MAFWMTHLMDYGIDVLLIDLGQKKHILLLFHKPTGHELAA